MVTMTTTPNVPQDVSIQDLLEAGLHFGHRTKRWNPKMRKYLFGPRNGIYIIDLEQTLEGLQKARQFIYDTVARGRQILFVGTKKQAQEALRNIATQHKQPFVVNRWLGGTLTNNETIRLNIDVEREAVAASQSTRRVDEDDFRRQAASGRWQTRLAAALVKQRLETRGAGTLADRNAHRSFRALHARRSAFKA